MKNFKLKDFSLTFILFILFFVSILGQIIFGFQAYNEELLQKNVPLIANWHEYISTGHFLSSLSENMESEFLQMTLFVYLTAFLIQKGSAESKKPQEEKTFKDIAADQEEEEYCKSQKKLKPLQWFLYENSLSLSLFLLFLISFLFHAWGSFELINQRNIIDAKPLISFTKIFSESEFWFESFQNWQSEFFSIALMGLLSIFFRQKGSPQSKRLRDPYWKTGGN